MFYKFGADFLSFYLAIYLHALVIPFFSYAVPDFPDCKILLASLMTKSERLSVHFELLKQAKSTEMKTSWPWASPRSGPLLHVYNNFQKATL